MKFMRFSYVMKPLDGYELFIENRTKEDTELIIVLSRVDLGIMTKPKSHQLVAKHWNERTILFESVPIQLRMSQYHRYGRMDQTHIVYLRNMLFTDYYIW